MMEQEKEKILSNVFIPAGGDKLKLCDIHFTESIEKIIPRTERLFEWDEIKDIHQIKKLRDEFPLSKGESTVYDGAFLIAVPGGIDPHVHFNTPGFEYRDTFSEASFAAVWGGVTTVIDMPCTSIPPVTKVENFNKKLEAVSGTSYADYAFWGGVPGNDFNERGTADNIFGLAGAGVAAFKAYFISGMDTFRDLTIEEMKIAALTVKGANKILAVHAEDREMILNEGRLAGAGEMKQWETYCRMRSTGAEVKAVENMISISKETGCRIHIVHLSSGAALNLISEARSKGVQITAETCPHYLYFTQDSFRNKSIRNYLKTAPPVKTEEDREALWEGLANGTLDFVSTDHAGCNPEREKSSSDFSEVYGGIPGVEHRVPFILSEGFLKRRITLEQAVNILSSNAARIFGLKEKGFIKEGYDADIILADARTTEMISASDMHSKGKYTPFEGVRLGVSVRKTFLRGNLIIDKNSASVNTMNNPKRNCIGRFIYV